MEEKVKKTHKLIVKDGRTWIQIYHDRVLQPRLTRVFKEADDKKIKSYIEFAAS